MKARFALLFLFLGLVFSQAPVSDDEVFAGAEEVETQEMPVQNEEEMAGGMDDETSVEGMLDERSDHRCGNSYKEYTASKKGNGACRGADYNGTGAHQHLSASTAEACAAACKSKYSGTVYVEFNAGKKWCDCQKGSSCSLLANCSTCRGFVAYKIGSKAGTCGGSRCCSRWGWCGGNKNNYENKISNARTGVCTNRDSKRYTGVTSAQSCADKCLAFKASTKFIEYASSIKTCDCDDGTKCTINKSHSYHRKFKVYDIKKQRKYDAWCTSSNSILNHLWGTAAYSEDVSVTVTSAVAGVVGLIGFGSFKLSQKLRTRGAEYESLLDV